jgi:hypothetical protein
MGIQMTDQFDLEQGIMGCWNVTDDLELLFEELCENEENFSRDDATNFVLGLQRIYESKFDKLFRTFEEFLKTHYRLRDKYDDAMNEIDRLNEEQELSLEDGEFIIFNVFDEHAEDEAAFVQRMMDSHVSLPTDDELDLVEDEFGFR